MIGAIIGDIAGSRFEWHNCKSKDFKLFGHGCSFTDDTVMTVAVAESLLRAGPGEEALAAAAVETLQQFGRRHMDAGYGGRFRAWLISDTPAPYHSWGNGAAMRVSPVAWAARTPEEVHRLSAAVTGITHDHPEGLRGAEAAAMAVFLARQGESLPGIRAFIHQNYYPLNFTIDDIRPAYRFDVSCAGSVPVALEAFLESESFEDAIRTAVSVGGDSDTIAAITGAAAEAYYGVPQELRTRAAEMLTADLRDTLDRFEARYGAGGPPSRP